VTESRLRDAVTERWLASISEPLEAVANGTGPAPERLHRWLDLLVSASSPRSSPTALHEESSRRPTLPPPVARSPTPPPASTTPPTRPSGPTRQRCRLRARPRAHPQWAHTHAVTARPMSDAPALRSSEGR